MRGSLIAVGGAGLLVAMTAVAAQHVDTRPRGAVLFENRCARCHGLNGDGDGGLGPSLIGVIGRPAASRKDFLYSAALKAKGGVWTTEMLDQYLADPQAFAPGADMDVNSPDPAERAAIIEHIKTLK